LQLQVLHTQKKPTKLEKSSKNKTQNIMNKTVTRQGENNYSNENYMRWKQDYI